MYRNPVAKGEYRNHPCICGSGKKMKKCHGANYAITADEHQDIVRLGKEHNQRARDFDQALIEKAKELNNEKDIKGNSETLSDAKVLAQEGQSGA